MKHLLTPLLLLIGLTGLAQPTYLDLFIQFDQYPNETSWLVTQGTDTVYTSPSYDFQSYVNSTAEQRLFLEAGVEYKFYMFDTFGDGICCAWGDGSFILENECEGPIIVDGTFGENSTPEQPIFAVDYSFTLAPCIPEILTADVTFRVDLANAPPGIETPGVLGSWNGWQVIPMTLGGNGIWFADVEVPLGNHLWKFADFNDPDIQELPVGVNDSPCFQFDQLGFVNRTLNITEEDEIILPPYCWESCLPCGGIAGCSNPNAINWSPWANFDDGSCIVQNTDCPSGETIIEIRVTPDQWGGETSWKLYNNFGEVAAVEPQSCNGCGDGEYSNSPPFIPVSTFLCIPTGIEYDLVIFDTYGDGMLGGGGVQIFDCEGTELYNLQDEHPDGNFGYNTVSPQFTPTECDTITIIEGCTDSDYVEYNPEATNNDGSCLTEKVYGCLDPTQFNFDPDANTEDIIPFCDYTLTITDGVGDGWFGSWLGIYQLGTIFNSPQYQMGPNDGTELSFNISGLDATQPAYIYFFVTPQSINTAIQCGFSLTNSEGEVIIEVPSFFIIPFLNESGWYAYEIDLYCGSTCEPFIFGCQSPIALNYNDEANIDDGSCYYEPGCTSAGYLEYYTQGFEADFDDGSCLTEAEFGCTDPLAPNYDEDANVDTGCIPVLEGCTNELAFNFDLNANTDDGSCIPINEGCIDLTAFNFDPLANTDDGSCIDTILGCTDDSASNYDVTANTNDGSCIPLIYGCMDITAFNYDPLATENDGSCIPILIGCTDSTAFNFNTLANTNFGCVPVILGCIDQSAVNYNEFNLVPPPNTDDGSCFYAILGCIEEGACNYNELANTNDGTCEYLTCSGCTELNACNYDPTATIDNNNCEYPEVNYDCDGECLSDIDGDGICDEEELVGCTDPTAANFIESATDDDGSCLYDAGCVGEGGDPYWLNDPCYAWVIDVSPSCCNNEWANGCQELYNFCDLNDEISNIDEFGETQIIVFPNPARDRINIASNLRINAVLYNSIGQPVLQKTNVNQLDLSRFEAGIYNLILTHNDLQFTKKIIKQ